MNITNIPGWVYFPLKVLILISFTVPIFLWAGQITDMSREAESAFLKGELGKLEQAHLTDNDVKTTLETLDNHSNGKSFPGADSKKIQGIDVSHFQGIVHWEKVANAGIHFAFAKATGGNTYVDPRFHENWRGSREAGLHRGAYHFFYASDDPKKQAKHYLSTVGIFRDKDLPPVLDVEITDHTKPKLLLERVIVWLETVEKETGRRPILYTNLNFAKQYLDDSRLSKYPLWIAEYRKKIRAIPSPWVSASWTFWQHSQNATISGVKGNVDLSVFNGTLKQLNHFIDQSKTP